MNKPKAYIGIDPGVLGSICLLVPDISTTFVSTKADISQLYSSFIALPNNYTLAPIMVEDVHSVPTMAAKSNFSFGWNVGELHAIIKCAKLGMDLVQPKVWQKTCGIRMPKKATPIQRKQATVAVAKRIYPDAELYGPKGGLLDGRSDALMIAHYCRLKYN